MSRLVLFWLLVLDNLLANTSCLVGCLTLLKESDHLERVGRDCVVQVCKFELMCLGLRKEDLFTLLLRPGYFHCLSEVATLEVAEKLYSMPHELVHQHDSVLLCRMKPANQLVAYVWKTGDSLEVIPDAFIEVCLCTICLIWTSLYNDSGPLSQAYILKALTHEVKQQWTIVLLHILESSQNL